MRDPDARFLWGAGKIVGGNLNRMPAKRPLPTRGLGLSVIEAPLLEVGPSWTR